MKTFKKNLIGGALLLAGLFAFRANLQAQETPEISEAGLAYEVAGKGRTVVLIHGGLVDRRMWDDQFKKFAENYRVVRYDLRGFGKSKFPTAQFSHVEDLYDLLKLLKVEKASVIGLSLGGMIAIDFALEHPEMVESLILAGSAVRGYKYAPVGNRQPIIQAAEKGEVEKAVSLWLEDAVFSTAKNNASAFAKIRTMLTENFRGWSSIPPPLVKWSSYSSIERLPEIKAPTLVLVGDKDNENILGIAGVLAAKIPGARKVVLKQAGHHLNMEKPEEFNKDARRFLKKSLAK